MHGLHHHHHHHHPALFRISNFPRFLQFQQTRLLQHELLKPKESLLTIIRSCSKKTHLLQIHAHLLRTSLFHTPPLLTTFLNQTSHHDLHYSRQIFSQIEHPTILLCNTLLQAYSQSSSPEEALEFYRHMRRMGVYPNPFSSSFVVKSATRVSSILAGRQIHAAIVRDGHKFDMLLMTALMSFYANCGNCEDVDTLFVEMPQRDTVAWNVLIACYERNRRTRDALGLFEKMQAPAPNACRPDDVTCLLTIQACASLGTLDYGERIHRYVDEHGYSNSIKICNSLIDMYSNCGSLEKAVEVFRKMPVQNVITWSTLISGLAMNGYGRDAIDAFTEMCNMGISPDAHTFTGLLSACSHCGLKEEGLKYFDLMRTEFGIAPNIYHYNCIVDLLGRAGLLDEAYGLVRSIEVKHDAKIWRTLLGACRIHRHFVLGEHVISHLLELKAQEAGDYVLLLNIYASCENWEKVSAIRKLMKDKGIQTTPGCSTIEVKGKVHEFVVDDVSHPQKLEIYNMMCEIEGQLKIAGYVVNTTSELHNLDMEQKENVLSYHSEKLAIAFGILSTPPGRTLRIAKNLRICIDCHNFAKVLSGVYNRRVIIRDRLRFHHFHDGLCSCNDYW